MRYEVFQDRRIQVIDIDDTNGEHVIEFVDPTIDESGSILAVYGSGDGWSDAQVSISPKVESVSAEFVEWALSVARRKM
ncbi:hypothetical protein [Streptomyces sp. H39-C1]|uniref:hypothetical protein n=1 Tax=Streptomyces sp. H39-C1 TaxID=3004355 RepID=UPI0022AEB8C8|nr:hypothetical protein [Streptomyces sp. H39-C1]MCZ4099800.1 hypothetical protein [Streptomyces sp. H39-C1]